MPTTYATEDRETEEKASPKNETERKGKLLKRLQHRYDYIDDRFKRLRDRRRYSMQALSDDGPWLEEEKEARRNLKRPFLHLPQLPQYSDGLINEIRQNPLAIKVTPAGTGADEKTAELRGNRIRAIEYENNATQAYLSAFEGSVQGGWGVFGMLTEEMAWDSFNQRIKIIRFPDPEMVMWDPDWKMADCSDMQDAFVLEWIPRKDYARKWPDAEIQEFTADHLQTYNKWLNDDLVLVVAYWYIDKKREKVYLLEDGSPEGLKVHASELPKGAKAKDGMMVYPDGKSLPIAKEKTGERATVKRCVANCVEILEETTWAGKWIPIFPVLGKEKYLWTNGRVERILDSYIAPAIHAQRLFNSLATNELESVNQVPKMTFLGYEGQFDTSTDWEHIHQIRTPYAEVKPMVDPVTGQVLPLPIFVSYVPVELSAQKEGARRMIQAAIGSYGFTKSDDTNVKSGKAISALDKKSDMSSFHFIDNLKNAITHAGRCLGDLLDKIEDTERDVGTQAPDGTHKMVHLNGPGPDGQIVQFTDAPHDYTVETGPSYDSQREEATDFMDTLAPTPMFPLIADLAIKAKRLGPLGDQMAERLTPPQFQTKDGQEPLPPQATAALQKKDQELQALNAVVKEREIQVIELEDEKKAKTEELRLKKEIADMEDATKRYDIDKRSETAIKVAQIGAGAKYEELTSKENIHESEQAHAQALTAQQLGADSELTDKELAAKDALQDRQLSSKETLERDKLQTQAEQAAAEREAKEKLAAQQLEHAAESQQSQIEADREMAERQAQKPESE